MDDEEKLKYIKYLEKRLESLSQNQSIGDYDLNNLIDAQNEIILNNSYNFKWILNEKDYLVDQIEQLQKKIAVSEGYIQYLTNSYWWKITYPFRLVSRHLKRTRVYKPFKFYPITKIKNSVKIVIYASDPNYDLEVLIKNIYSQKGFADLKITMVDFANSNDLAKIAKQNDIEYINPLAAGESFLISKHINTNTDYIVYAGQHTFIEDTYWLYKMVRPIVDKYALFSALYDGKSDTIKTIKKTSFFNELKARIFKLGQYECVLFPTDRNKIQFIPSTIINDSLIVAKKCHE